MHVNYEFYLQTKLSNILLYSDDLYCNLLYQNTNYWNIMKCKYCTNGMKQNVTEATGKE